jgi:hypothetical protein
MEAVGTEENDSRLSRYLADKLEKSNNDFNILNYWKVPYIIFSSKRCACCAYFYRAFGVGF